MKLQPKLRMNAQDWDYTKEKMDMSLLHDIKKRDKREESKRLMQSLHQQEQTKTLMLSSNVSQNL